MRRNRARATGQSRLARVLLVLDTAAFLRRVADQGLTDAQRQKLSSAFELLTPLHRGIVVAGSMDALAIEKARALYEELGRTPFVSVYGGSIAEDFAELVAWWQMTEIHGQPYRIEVREGGRVIQSYEPMQSSLVRSRLSGLAPFDSPYAPSSDRSAP